MITHLDQIVVASRRLEQDLDAWSCLLGRAGSALDEGAQLNLANGSLVLQGSREVDDRGPLRRLVFGTNGDGQARPTDALGVPIAFETHHPQAPSPLTLAAHVEDAVCAIDHVVVRCADLDRSKAFYESLGIRMALDRSFPERGVRLVFFRCGGVTLELSGSLETPPKASDDTLWGIAWRVPNADAARERVRGCGFRVSAVRDGHKTGTRVFHLEDGPSEVPTLVLEDPSRRDTPPHVDPEIAR